MSSIRYRRELDGLRAVAVLPVLLFHLNGHWPSGGFLGVDVFFVISGFLITSIILKEQAEGVFSLRKFWLRRVRRILPALVTMVLASLLATYFLLFKGEHQPIGFQAVSALLSFANFAMWKTKGDYWGPQAETSPFLHTWSLSVEEQFYLVYPLLLLGILKFRPRWKAAFPIWITAGGLALFLLRATNHSAATFFLLPTRAWELGVGCALAAILDRPEPAAEHPQAQHLAAGGLLLMLVSYYALSGDSGVSGAFVIPVLGAALVIAYSQTGVVNWLLSLAPVVFIGKISYSLYIWHWPALMFLRRITDHPQLPAVAVTIVASLLSYYLIERPARRGKNAVPFILLGHFATLVAALYLFKVPGRYDTSAYHALVYNGPHYDVSPKPDVLPEFKRAFPDVQTRDRDPGEAGAYQTGGIIKRYGGENPDLVVLGDSHAEMWSGVIDEVAQEFHLTVSFYAIAGVAPFIHWPISHTLQVNKISPEQKYLYDSKRVEFIEKWNPKTVIVSVHWAHFHAADAEEFFSFLAKHSQHILVIEQPPELTIGNANLRQYLCFKKFVPQDGVSQYFAQGNRTDTASGREMVQTLAKEFPTIEVIPTYARFTRPDGQVWVLDGRDVLYLDDDHLSQAGAAEIRGSLEDAVRRALAN